MLVQQEYISNVRTCLVLRKCISTMVSWSLDFEETFINYAMLYVLVYTLYGPLMFVLNFFK